MIISVVLRFKYFIIYNKYTIKCIESSGVALIKASIYYKHIILQVSHIFHECKLCNPLLETQKAWKQSTARNTQRNSATFHDVRQHWSTDANREPAIGWHIANRADAWPCPLKSTLWLVPSPPPAPPLCWDPPPPRPDRRGAEPRWSDRPNSSPPSRPPLIAIRQHNACDH